MQDGYIFMQGLSPAQVQVEADDTTNTSNEAETDIQNNVSCQMDEHVRFSTLSMKNSVWQSHKLVIMYFLAYRHMYFRLKICHLRQHFQKNKSTVPMMHAPVRTALAIRIYLV